MVAPMSNHAVKRIRQRLGLNKSAAQREAERALDGIPHGETVGQLRKYLDNQAIRHGSGFRVTPMGIFAYRGDCLTTVMQVPPHLRNTTLAQWKKFKSEDV